MPTSLVRCMIVVRLRMDRKLPVMTTVRLTLMTVNVAVGLEARLHLTYTLPLVVCDASCATKFTGHTTQSHDTGCRDTSVSRTNSYHAQRASRMIIREA